MADPTLLPADGPDVTPDDELAAALDALAVDTGDAPKPLGRGWAFDFSAGDFVFHGQGPARVDGTDELRVWCEKALRTARLAHAVYSDDFGSDVVELIGAQPTPELIGEYQQAIEDALLVHDRVSAVQDFAFTTSPDTDYVLGSFTVVTDEGDEIPLQTPTPEA